MLSTNPSKECPEKSIMKPASTCTSWVRRQRMGFVVRFLASLIVLFKKKIFFWCQGEGSAHVVKAIITVSKKDKGWPLNSYSTWQSRERGSKPPTQPQDGRVSPPIHFQAPLLPSQTPHSLITSSPATGCDSVLGCDTKTGAADV